MLSSLSSVLSDFVKMTPLVIFAAPSIQGAESTSQSFLLMPFSSRQFWLGWVYFYHCNNQFLETFGNEKRKMRMAL